MSSGLFDNMRPQTMNKLNTRKNDTILFLLIALVLIAGVTLRALYLTADPPTDITISGGIVGDAGQHSYGARNKILFDQWSFDDWTPHVAAPVLNIGVNYPVYKIFGINLASHRLIPVVFSSLALLFLAFMVSRLLGPWPGLLASAFVAFNYPLLIYSKAASRYFPMIFFFLVALYLFLLGVERQKEKYFFWSAFTFMVSYLAQNHILYLLSLFMVISVLWLILRRIRLRDFAIYWGSMAAFLGSWYVLLYLPNRNFFDFFVGHNKLVRKVGSLQVLLRNLFENPMMTQMRSDPVVWILAAAAIMLWAYLWFTKMKKTPVLVETAALWLLAGAVAHSLFGYRPTRFYLILVFPAAILAGWLIDGFIKRSHEFRWNVFGVIAFLTLPVSLFFFGFLKYWQGVWPRISANGWWAAGALLFTLSLGILVSMKKRHVAIAASIVLVLIPVWLNSGFFFRWASNREYKVANTIDVFARVIPPSEVAGNWASLLSTGTPHRTHLLSGEMGVNWRRDFLKQQKIRYALLTKGNFGNELREYRRFFRSEMEAANLMALFRIYNTDVSLFDLYPVESDPQRIEGETLRRSAGMVSFNPEASQQMVLSVDKKDLGKPLRLGRSDITIPEGRYQIGIAAQGSFKGKIVFFQQNKKVKEGLIKFTGKAEEIITIDNIPLNGELSCALLISRMDSDTIAVDYFQLRHIVE
jgi:4-amino-4-deoxy-L-arabinose transferase-like glycosyltransferase